MKRTVICTVGAFLLGISSSVFALSLDAKTLTSAMNASHSVSGKGLATVYGGQDISRGTMQSAPVLVG